MDWFIDIVSKIDIITLVAMASMLWYLKSHMDTKIDKLDDKMEKQGQRIDRLYELYCETQKEIKEMNIRFHQEIKEMYKSMSQK